MKIKLTAALLVVLVLAPEPAPGDQERIQGTWAAVEVECNGVPSQYWPADLARRREEFLRTRLTFRGDKVFKGQEKELWAGFTLDPSATPPALDLIPASGAKLPHKMLYAYRLFGDRLYLCLTATSKTRRPTEVTSKNNQLLLILERQRESQK